MRLGLWRGVGRTGNFLGCFTTAVRDLRIETMICKSKTFRTLVAATCLGLWASVASAFDAPKDPRGTEIGQSTVKWEWERVEGADLYEVVIDGSKIDLTRDPQYFSYNLWAGEHSLTVRAKKYDGTYSARTPTIKIIVNEWFTSASHSRSFVVSVAEPAQPSPAPPPPVVVEVVDMVAPADPRGTVLRPGVIKWEWAAVASASNYDVHIDGVYAATVSETHLTSYDLWEGEHSFSVASVDAVGNISPRSATVKVWLNNGTEAAREEEPTVVEDTPAPPPPPPSTAAGDPNAANVRSMIDPASSNYPEVFQKDGYELSFSDEFEGTAINPYRWNTGLRWDGEFNGERYEYRVVNGEDQLYVNINSADEEHRRDIVPSHNPFEFNGTQLSIRAIKNPLKNNNGDLPYGSLDEIAAQQTFLSGAITTHDKFSQKFGIFEARIRIPSHIGTFPAFWLFHENRAWEGTQRSEIDIMENLGHAPWYVYNSFHYFKNVSTTYGGDAHFVRPYPNGQVYTGTDFSQDFHVYAVQWEPGKVIWMIDGEKVSELQHSEVNHEELYVKLNLAMGGNWTNYPANSGGLGRADWDRYPNQNDLNNFNNPALEIDYVRVYKPK